MTYNSVMESQEAELQFKNEAEIIRTYLPAFEKLNQGKLPEIKGITGEHEGDISRAWRIIFKPPGKVESCAIFDWDDTLEPYTERKPRLYKSYLSLIPNVNPTLREKFLNACKTLNAAARVLPVNGTHPEHYSPLLELVATSILVKSIQKSKTPDFLNALTGSQEDESLARTYLIETVLPKLQDQIGVKEKTKNGSPKKYFVELANQSTSVRFNEKPSGVDEEVWSIYMRTMTGSNIPADEIDHFDLSENVRFIVATFGEAGFQLEKVLRGIEAVSAKGRRIPDEILLYTRGRKNPIIEKLVKEIPEVPFVYVDDSPRQVESVRGIDRVTPLHAQRQGSKRSSEKVSADIREVDMEVTNLSAVARLVEPKKF